MDYNVSDIDMKIHRCLDDTTVGKRWDSGCSRAEANGRPPKMVGVKEKMPKPTETILYFKVINKNISISIVEMVYFRYSYSE